jgi:hypothetical protein
MFITAGATSTVLAGSQFIGDRTPDSFSHAFDSVFRIFVDDVKSISLDCGFSGVATWVDRMTVARPPPVLARNVVHND